MGIYFHLKNIRPILQLSDYFHMKVKLTFVQCLCAVFFAFINIEFAYAIETYSHPQSQPITHDVVKQQQSIFNNLEEMLHFDDFADIYKESNSDARASLLALYIDWQQDHGGFPIIEEDGSVVFIYLRTGDEQSVNLVGDFSAQNFYSVEWDPFGYEMLPLAEDEKVFFLRLLFENDARLEYKYIVDGEDKQDALNPNTAFSGVGGDVSELIMPEYSVPSEINLRSEIAQGSLAILDEDWMIEDVTIYLPPDYNPNAEYSVIYTADGSAWLDLMILPTLLDNLIAEKHIDPVIAVMIDAAEDRSDWYFYNPNYLIYLEKVVQFVDTHYATKADASNRVHIGTSAGGRITLYVGFERPDLILNLGMLSPSLIGPPHYYAPYFSGKKHPDPNLAYWFSAGAYEGYIYADVKTMHCYFKAENLNSQFITSREGHSFNAWRNHAVAMLIYFFG